MIWEPIIVKPGKWFNVYEADVMSKLRYFKQNHKKLKHQAKILGMNNRGKHSLDAMKNEFSKILDNLLEQIPKNVSLKLPKLKKKTESKPPAKIKLPKLKKVT